MGISIWFTKSNYPCGGRLSNAGFLGQGDGDCEVGEGRRGERIGADAGIEIEIGIDNQTLQTHAKRIETMRFTCFQLLWTAIGYMGWRMRRGRAECHIITMRKRSGPAKTPRAPGGANGFRVMTTMSSWSAGVCLVSQAEKFVVLISNA